MPNPKLASAYAIHKNNHSKGGYISGLHPHQGHQLETTDNEVDMLHKAIGGSIVDHIMARRAEAKPEGSQAGMSPQNTVDNVNAEDDDDFLSGQPADEFSDEMDNTTSPKSEEEGEEQSDGQVDLKSIMAAIRKKHMGRR